MSLSQELLPDLALEEQRSSLPQVSDELWHRLVSLDVVGNAREVVEFGYTIIPDAVPFDLLGELHSEILRVNDELEPGQYPTMLLERGRAFERVVLLPKVLAVMELLLGPGFILSQLSGSVKRKSPTQFGIHTDCVQMPDPFPAQPYVVTAIIPTERFSREGGCTRVVPKSHLRGRHPLPGEGEHEAVPLEFERGSVGLWNGATWHGNHGREIDGERVVAHMTCNRVINRPVEVYDLPQEVLERNPPELAAMLGYNDMFGRRWVGDPHAPLRSLRAT